MADLSYSDIVENGLIKTEHFTRLYKALMGETHYDNLVYGADDLNSDSASGEKTINLTNQVSFKLTLAGDTTLSFSGGVAGRTYLFVIEAGEHTLTLPDTILWPSGVAGEFTENGKDIISILYLSETVQFGNVINDYKEAS